MIPKFNLLSKYINLLLVFLFPVQLAIHFWPDFALIFGIRVDYLAPTIYLTDVLFMVLFFPWVFRNWGLLISDLKKAKYYLVIVFIFLLLNLGFSSHLPTSFFKWAKILEFILLGYYIKSRRDIFTQKNIFVVSFGSLVTFSLVGILQFMRGQTLGGLLYFVGERSFSIFTPGIALVNILGKNYLRAYSTFPHPNALAGFIGAAILFLLPRIKKKKSILVKICLPLILLTFVLTFSLSSFVGMFICLLIYYFPIQQTLIKKTSNLVLIILMITSFIFSYLSKPMLNMHNGLPKSSLERLELAAVSQKMFSSSWTVGTGLNTFIPNEVKFFEVENIVWLLQPVHNVYLLVLTEGGVFAILLLYILSSKVFINTMRKSKTNLYLAILFIFITSLFDHYWFTSQQNLLLLSLLFGISFREKT